MNSGALILILAAAGLVGVLVLGIVLVAGVMFLRRRAPQVPSADAEAEALDSQELPDTLSGIVERIRPALAGLHAHTLTISDDDELAEVTGALRPGGPVLSMLLYESGYATLEVAIPGAPAGLTIWHDEVEWGPPDEGVGRSALAHGCFLEGEDDLAEQEQQLAGVNSIDLERLLRGIHRLELRSLSLGDPTSLELHFYGKQDLAETVREALAVLEVAALRVVPRLGRAV